MDFGEKEMDSTINKDIKVKKEKSRLDARSIDTLFRTISRNHYSLLRMVDNKASIILTVNSILISLLFGATQLAPDGEIESIERFFSVLIYFCLGSMVFSLVGMMPHTYYGKKFKLSSYSGSLYAGNFAKKSLLEFLAEFKRITSNSSSVIEEMTVDFYFLGRAIKFKQTMIKLALFTLLIGLVWSVFYSQIQS